MSNRDSNVAAVAVASLAMTQSLLGAVAAEGASLFLMIRSPPPRLLSRVEAAVRVSVTTPVSLRLLP